VADNWITNFQDLTEVLWCTDGQNVNYAGLKLDGEAKFWWKARNVLIAEELFHGVCCANYISSQAHKSFAI
jgi:hypothetical protein